MSLDRWKRRFLAHLTLICHLVLGDPHPPHQPFQREFAILLRPDGIQPALHAIQIFVGAPCEQFRQIAPDGPSILWSTGKAKEETDEPRVDHD